MSVFFRIISVFLLLSWHVSLHAQPKLVVLLAIDQLRPERITPEMPGGLGRLMRSGRVFTNATLDHALTNTCPGHITISSGVHPAKAGMPGNEYIDHATLAERYCVDDMDEASRVYGSQDLRSPVEIAVTTIGDWLKRASPGSKVFSVAGKDRAAITLGGRNPDGVFWYNRDSAGFTSSRFYGPLPVYVESLNTGGFFEGDYGSSIPATWVHPAGSSWRADDYRGESTEHLRVSGHPLNTGSIPERIEQVYDSPFLDHATAELVRRVFLEEKLGQRGVTDLLAVSFSATDNVGHLYGPFSAESADTLQRLDVLIGDLLDLLDEKLGGDYIVALSSDHGVLPLPEWLAEEGEMNCPAAGGRISTIREILRMYSYLYFRFTFPFGNPVRLVGYSAAGLVVSEAYANKVGTSREEVIAALKSYLERRPYVVTAWTVQDIAGRSDPAARLFRNSHVPGKSGDLMLQLAETCLLTLSDATTHGSLYGYDREVPLIFFGRGVRQGSSAEESHTIDIAPTLGSHLDLALPADLDGEILDIFQ